MENASSRMGSAGNAAERTEWAINELGRFKNIGKLRATTRERERQGGSRLEWRTAAGG
jgi:hypothetical protein